MDVTTPRLIRADFVAQIKAIVPSFVEHQTSRWREVRSIDEVPSAELRNFHIWMGVGAPSTTYGSGVEYVVEMQIWTSYGALAPEDDDSIITEDATQVWDALQARYEPALPGLISVEPLRWIDGDDDDGRRWGAHTFEVRYLARA